MITRCAEKNTRIIQGENSGWQGLYEEFGLDLDLRCCQVGRANLKMSIRHGAILH